MTPLNVQGSGGSERWRVTLFVMYGPARSDTNEHSPLVPLRRLCRAEGVDHRVARRAALDGELPAYRPGVRWVLVRPEDFAAWLESKRIGVQGLENDEAAT